MLKYVRPRLCGIHIVDKSSAMYCGPGSGAGAAGDLSAWCSDTGGAPTAAGCLDGGVNDAWNADCSGGGFNVGDSNCHLGGGGDAVDSGNRPGCVAGGAN